MAGATIQDPQLRLSKNVDPLPTQFDRPRDVRRGPGPATACLAAMDPNAGAFDKLFPAQPIGPANGTYEGLRDFFISSNQEYCDALGGNGPEIEDAKLRQILATTASKAQIRNLLLQLWQRIAGKGPDPRERFAAFEILQVPSVAQAEVDAVQNAVRAALQSLVREGQIPANPKLVAECVSLAERLTKEYATRSYAELGQAIGPAEIESLQRVAAAARLLAEAAIKAAK